MAQPFVFLRRPATAVSLSASIAQSPFSSSSISRISQAQFHTPASQHRCQSHRSARIRTRCQRLQHPFASALRRYHSTHHPFTPFPANAYTSAQSTILSAALLHVPKHGFTAQSLTLGARDAGYLDVSLQLFPRGGEIELVLFWLGSRRCLLKDKVEKGEIFPGPSEGEGKIHNKELSTEEKVQMLIIERLQMNEGVIHQWQDVSFCCLNRSSCPGCFLLSVHMDTCNMCDIFTWFWSLTYSGPGPDVVTFKHPRFTCGASHPLFRHTHSR